MGDEDGPITMQSCCTKDNVSAPKIAWAHHVRASWISIVYKEESGYTKGRHSTPREINAHKRVDKAPNRQAR